MSSSKSLTYLYNTITSVVVIYPLIVIIAMILCVPQTRWCKMSNYLGYMIGLLPLSFLSRYILYSFNKKSYNIFKIYFVLLISITLIQYLFKIRRRRKMALIPDEPFAGSPIQEIIQQKEILQDES